MCHPADNSLPNLLVHANTLHPSRREARIGKMLERRRLSHCDGHDVKFSARNFQLWGAMTSQLNLTERFRIPFEMVFRCGGFNIRFRRNFFRSPREKEVSTGESKLSLVHQFPRLPQI